MTASPSPCRVIQSGAAEGAWNMAVDEAILECAVANGAWTLRFYEWARPTLSLGYFQRTSDRQGHAASRDCPLVRRPSGGGAILHDLELTYCAVVPAGHSPARRAEWLYEALHSTLIGALADCGVAGARRVGDENSQPAAESFLCFARRMPMDVVLQGAKIAGSAQRRRLGAVLQHGSVLLGRSAAAPELAGIAEVSGQPIETESLVASWLKQLGPTLALTFVPGELSDAESRHAERLRAGKYANDSWTLRR